MKKLTFCVYATVCLLIIATPAHSQQNTRGQINSEKTEAQDRKISENEFQLKMLSQQVSEIRRDQINYSIEKNLIKDTYTSSYNNINTVITVVLGFFAFFGYVGWKDIGTLKKDHQLELDKLSTKTIEVSNLIDQFKRESSEIIKANKKQSDELAKVRAVQSANTFFQRQRFDAALEAVEQGLAIDPEDAGLLDLKLVCLGKLGRFKPYHELLESLRKKHCGEIGYILNDLEAMLFLQDLDGYESLLKLHHIEVVKSKGLEIIEYFNALKLYLSGNFDHLKAHIIKRVDFLAANIKPDAPILHPGWVFDEALLFLQSRPDSNAKTILVNYINLISSAKRDYKTAKAAMEGIK